MGSGDCPWTSQGGVLDSPAAQHQPTRRLTECRGARSRSGSNSDVPGALLVIGQLVGPNDTMNALCQDAQRMSLMLQFGLATGADVVRWADSQIVALDSASGPLLDLSTTPPANTGDLLSHLRALASGAHCWAAFRAVLGPLHDHIASNPARAEYFANELYRAAIWFESGDVPKDLSFVYGFDDAFSLAREGAYGQPEDVLREFLTELERFKGQVQQTRCSEPGDGAPVCNRGSVAPGH